MELIHELLRKLTAFDHSVDKMQSVVYLIRLAVLAEPGGTFQQLFPDAAKKIYYGAGQVHIKLFNNTDLVGFIDNKNKKKRFCFKYQCTQCQEEANVP